MYKPKRSTKFQKTCISWPLAFILGQSGSQSLSAINFETGISEPHHQKYHVTISYGQLTISQWAYRFLSCILPTMLQSFTKLWCHCVSKNVFFELFFVNKLFFAATKVDFQYFGHIFVWAPTRGKGLTITINFSPDILFHIKNFWVKC